MLYVSETSNVYMVTHASCLSAHSPSRTGLHSRAREQVPLSAPCCCRVSCQSLPLQLLCKTVATLQTVRKLPSGMHRTFFHWSSKHGKLWWSVLKGA